MKPKQTQASQAFGIHMNLLSTLNPNFNLKIVQDLEVSHFMLGGLFWLHSLISTHHFTN